MKCVCIHLHYGSSSVCVCVLVLYNCVVCGNSHVNCIDSDSLGKNTLGGPMLSEPKGEIATHRNKRKRRRKGEGKCFVCVKGSGGGGETLSSFV